MDATAGSLDKKFGPKLQQFMQYCETNPSEFNKIAQVQQRVQEVKDIVIENIDKVRPLYPCSLVTDACAG